jgi:antibiotic biosynthesis monooxygenase (ABM) superfamily enzyme
MGFINKDESIQELHKKSAKIPGTADWIKSKGKQEKVAEYKDQIIEKAAQLRKR